MSLSQAQNFLRISARLGGQQKGDLVHLARKTLTLLSILHFSITVFFTSVLKYSCKVHYLRERLRNQTAIREETGTVCGSQRSAIQIHLYFTLHCSEYLVLRKRSSLDTWCVLFITSFAAAPEALRNAANSFINGSSFRKLSLSPARFLASRTACTLPRPTYADRIARADALSSPLSFPSSA